MSSDTARVERQISIQSGVVKRLTKEVGYYKSESGEEQATLEKWEQGGYDEPKLRQQRTVVAQARAMVPDTAQRLEAAVAQLKALLDNAVPDAAVAKSEAVSNASELLKAAEAVLSEHAASSA